MRKYFLLLSLIVICIIPHLQGQSKADSWSEIKRKGSGSLVVNFSENSPFIYTDSKGNMTGIEVELLEAFVHYLQDKYPVNIDLIWEHLPTFDALLDTLNLSSRPIMGVASISTLEERKKYFNITTAYMPDIEVIVSSNAFQSIGNLSDFAKMVKQNTAISVPQSTFEKNILELKTDYFPEIQVKYVAHVDDLIEELSTSDNLWAYISLPNYLSNLKKGKNIRRHRFFMVENPGISMATPLSSDWVETFDQFMNSPAFKPLVDRLIEEYLGVTFLNVVNEIADQKTNFSKESNDSKEVGVLILERELQDLRLKQNEQEIAQKNFTLFIAISGIILVLIALFILYRLIRLKSRTNKSLQEKNSVIEQQNAALTALNEEKNELLGIVAHDLKNPLTSALSVTELFRDEEITEDQQEYVALIHKSLSRMNGLIARILEIKVLEAEALSLNYSEFEISEVIAQIIDDLKIKSNKKNIDIYTELIPVSGRLDRNLLTQILDNLISNAVKFSPSHTQIYVRLSCDKDTTRIEVEDEGPGISEEDKPKLFKKFQKMKAKPTGGESSTGLGLSIVKKYTEAMGGKVWCENNRKTGARFIVEFFNSAKLN